MPVRKEEAMFALAVSLLAAAFEPAPLYFSFRQPL